MHRALRRALPEPSSLRALALALAGLAAASPACTANLDEGCIGGPCGGATSPAPATTSDAGTCPNTQATGDFPKPVAAVLENCQRCHAPADHHPQQQGPFELMRYEDVKQTYAGQEVWQRMGKAVRSGLMPAAPPALTNAEKKTLLDWLDACAPPAPEGQGCDVGEGCAAP
jgi:hypothetical protein